MNISETAYVAPGARIIGQVTLDSRSSVWFNAVLRADSDTITIGPRSNIQDNCTVHTDAGWPVCVGANVTVGHNCVLHGCQIDDECLIGMGSVLMNGAHVGRHSIIGAGSLVTSGTVIPEGSLVMGSPARVRRQLTPQEIESICENAQEYVDLAQKYERHH